MPSTSFKERATSPKERIIPIKIENEPKWENDSLDKIKYNKSKRIEDDNDDDTNHYHHQDVLVVSTPSICSK